jgi:hypothetical protein
MIMNTKIQIKIIGVLFGVAVAVVAIFGLGGAANAATSIANFDPTAGTLSVNGSCSGRFVLVLIKNATSGAVWGSSNPLCVNGVYSYSIAVPDNMRTGGAFSVSAVDNGVSASAVGGGQPVIFSQAPGINQTASSSISSDTTSISLDTSSVDAAPDDVSVLDGFVQGFFGIATSAVNAVESSVVAAMHFFVKIFTILPGGSINVPSGQNEISGQAMLPAGATSVFIANTSVATSSDILITPTSPTQAPLSVMQIQSGNGFYIGVASAQTAGVGFTWIIVNTYADSTSTMPTQPQESMQQGQSLVITPPVVSQTETSSQSTSTDAITADTTVVASSTLDVGSGDATTSTSTDVSVPAPAPPAVATSSDDGGSADVASSTGQ